MMKKHIPRLVFACSLLFWLQIAGSARVELPLSSRSPLRNKRWATDRSKKLEPTEPTTGSASMANKFVVLGGGVSAGYFARAYVERGFPRNSLVLVSWDSALPYERPALSKGYLTKPETRPVSKFYTSVGSGAVRQDASWYQQHGIDVHLNTRVLSIDLHHKLLRTSVGDIPFYKLILATGCDPIIPNWQGKDLPGVHFLREIADADAILRSFDHAKQRAGRAVIVGGGYIGLETAAGCLTNDIPTTMIFPNPHLMDPFFPSEVGQMYEQFYVEKGIEIRKLQSVTGFKPTADGTRVKSVCLDNGDEIDCSFVIVGVGARPRTDLFKDALTMHSNHGVVVDEYMQTSHPDVYAIGDIAAYPNAMYPDEGYTRVEHVDNARRSAEHLADVLQARELGKGQLKPYKYLPFFYSREFELSWKFYGRQKGNYFIAGNLFELDSGFVVTWMDDRGRVQGVFAESARDDEFQWLREAARLQLQLPLQEAATARRGKDIIFLIRDALIENAPTDEEGMTLKKRIVELGKSAMHAVSDMASKITS